MQQPSYPCSCIICKRLTTSLGIVTHVMRSHGSDAQKKIWNGSTNRAKTEKAQRIATYNTQPALCGECNLPIDYARQKTNTFCSSKCAAIRSNAARTYRPTEAHKEKVRQSAIAYRIAAGYIPKQPAGPHCKLFKMRCVICQDHFMSRTRTTYCNAHLDENRNLTRLIYYFKFNIYLYPDLFDLKQLAEKGFFSAGGRNKLVNISGMSRDHRVSVSEAVKYNYDPYYITHPINCELMTQIENSTKNARSSVSYEQLMREVNVYDALGSRSLKPNLATTTPMCTA